MSVALKISSLLEQYFENGLVVIPSLFSSSEIEEMKKNFEQLAQKAKEFTTPTFADNSYFVVEDELVHRIVWCCGNQPELAKHGRKPAILQWASSILGSEEFDQIICQAHFKHPGDGLKFDWHQDSQHRQYGSPNFIDLNKRGSFVQSVTALDPMTADNGPINFVPKSHRVGHLALDKNADVIDDIIEHSPVESLEMNPGDVVFFHPFLIHGSEANHSTTSRRIFINGFAYPDANSVEYPGCKTGVRLKIEDA